MRTPGSTTVSGTPPPSPRDRFGAWRQLRKHRTALAGLIVLGGFLVLTTLAPAILPYDPNVADLDHVLLPPSLAHPFGTDHLGRDLLTRVVFGTRVSFLIGILAVAFSASLGVPVGLVSGVRGGVVDLVVQRFVDLLLAFPGFLLALTLIAVLGVGITNVVVSVGLAAVPQYIRLARGVALSVKEQAFIEAARAAGVGEGRILLRHVLPNCLAPLIVQSTLRLGEAILVAAGLGFLGLGVKPPTPEWGTMLGEGQSYLFSSWYIATFPGLAIFLAVIAANLLGDGLRDALDPRLKQA